MTDDEPAVSLVFFSATHYIVHENGGVLTLLPGQSASDYPTANLSEGWAKVTKDELFERYPIWKTIYELLLKRLGETGSA